MDVLDAEAECEAIVAALRAAGRPYRGGISNDSYTGSGRPFFNASVPDIRRIVRDWSGAHRQVDASGLLEVADRLFVAEPYEARIAAAVIVGANARARRAATPAMAERWLEGLNGWAEVDSLCASVFGAEEMAADWPAWRALVERLSVDPNINKRRAALVLLTTPARTSPDARFADLAFEVVERLKAERPILITKAVSWLLRSLAPRHGAALGAYLDAVGPTLPAVALRETRAKLATGRKSGPRGEAKTSA
ncbi:MAG: DNA alkylation repair protein [Caulobacteraceae bacterium]